MSQEPNDKPTRRLSKKDAQKIVDAHDKETDDFVKATQMTNDKPAREFWVHKEYDKKTWDFTAVANMPVFLDNYFHVIEHSAYQALKLENERLEKELTFEGRLRNGLQEALITTLKAENAELREVINHDTAKIAAQYDSQVSDLQSEVARLREALTYYDGVHRLNWAINFDDLSKTAREALNHKPKGE